MRSDLDTFFLSMPSLALTYFVVFLCVVLIDSVYLYFVGGPWFQKQVVDVQRVGLEINYSAGVLCYLVIAALLTYFGFVDRTKLPGSEEEAFFMGLGIYAVFELTCKSIFVNWSWKTVALDSIWGGLLFALSLFASKRILRSYV